MGVVDNKPLPVKSNDTNTKVVAEKCINEIKIKNFNVIRGTEILYKRGLRIQFTKYDFHLDSNFHDYVNPIAGYRENIKLRPPRNCLFKM